MKQSLLAIFGTAQAASSALVLALTLGVVSISPVLAQNASQILAAKSGKNCSGCNLFQANLTNLTLNGRNFSKAKLRQADLTLGTFNRSNLSHTDLRDIDAYGALFTSANLSYSNMTNASFVGAYFMGANLKGAILKGVNFSGAQLSTARGLTQTQLEGACGDESTQLPTGLRIRYC